MCKWHPAEIQNFHLKGRGVNKATAVSGKTETIWKVRLRRGKYTFMCDPDASTMRGSFRVTEPPSGATWSPASPSDVAGEPVERGRPEEPPVAKHDGARIQHR